MPENVSPDSSMGTHGGPATGTMIAVPTRGPQVPVQAWSYGPPAIPEILHAKPGPVELLNALRRRWMVATGLGLLCGGILAALVWFLVPIRQEVVALMRIAASRPSIMGEAAGERETDFVVYKRTQAALLKSNFVLQATLRKPEVKRLSVVQDHKDDILDWLSGQLLVDFPGEAEIMRVSMRGERPKDLALIVNAVKDAYMDEIVNAEREERLRQRDTLDRLYRKNRDEIKKRIDELYSLHKQYGTSMDDNAVLARKMAMDNLNSAVAIRNSISQHIGEIEMRMLLAKTREETAKEVELPDFIIDQQISSDQQVQQLKQNLASITAAINEESQRVTRPDAPSLVRLQQYAQSIEEALDERRNELRPYLVESFRYNNRGERVTDFLPVLETELAALNEKLEHASKAVQGHLETLQKMEKNSAEVDTRTAELRELQDVTQRMGAELKLWAVELDARPRITSIEDASVPSGSDAVRKYLATAFAGLLGLAGVLFGIALLEFQSRRISSESEIREGLGIRVIGHLPSLSGRAWRKLGDSSTSAGAYLQSLLAESVDSIRATLMHSNGAHPPRVIMVSSADNQEGKTTVASQLAASLARAGRRTLLIDGDLRNATAHVVFGLPLSPGFSDVLRGEAEREAAIYATAARNLWLMPAGQLDETAVQAISGEVLIKNLQSLKESYEFVVVDAPPVLKVADPLIFGQIVDAAVISVRRDFSQIPKVYEACERLNAVGVKVLGAVVNGVNEKPLRRTAPISV